MLLSTGKTLAATPINGAGGIGETRALQANLGNNLASASATLVAGNANTVLDTVRTGDWKFYVAGNTSTAAITSASASSEWTVGNLMSYVSQSTPPIDMSFYYTMNTNTVSGSTVLDSVSGNYSATLGGTPIATISTTDPSPAPGQGYLSMVQTSAQHLQLPSITFSVATGLTFACWFRSNNTLNFGRIMDFGSPFPDISNNFFIAINDSNVIVNVRLNNSGSTYQVSTSGTNYNNNVWRHVVLTISTTGVWNVYIDGANKVLNYAGVYPKLMTRPSNLIGKSNWASQGDPYFNGAIDDFRIYYREISAADANAIYIGPIPASLKDTVTNTTWIPTPGVPVDATETNYTVKSNEIALAPGTNSTYAVWTAPKSTNLKIDVSFADYNSRSAGVGFQMFKINNDNTFGSVIFPRTVTSTALTNAAPTNYLSVPSRTISVATGDKIYYRVDANGNTTAASSVLATAIYTDTNQDLKQFKYLQANLGNNIASTSFVGGNANVVNDTLGTGNWKFYVAGNTSISSITGSSASSEWTSGSLLSYITPTVPPTNYSIFYPLNTADINPGNASQVGDLATGSYVYNGTLVGSASIVVDGNSRVAGQGYLSLIKTSAYFSFAPFNVTTSGFSFVFWGRFASTTGIGGRIIDIRDPEISLQREVAGFTLYVTGPGTLLTSGNAFDNTWRHYAVTFTYSGTSGATSTYTLYTNGSLTASVTAQYPALGTRNAHNLGTYLNTGSAGIDGGIDDFRIYPRPISAIEVNAIYAGASPASIKDITSGVSWMSVPGTAVDANETSYTVKSNEVALTPGTNSTYAVWTATKFTNLKIDVSFADYHTRSSGVGFQMFKIKSDNTFDSVLFPRTVTSTALTNANSSNSSNYLTVPSITTTVNVGDKLYYRVDANGNTIAASSVLATAIYTDDVSVAINPVETKLLQAQLGNNLASATLVAGNSNTVLDTVRTGDWKFYVAGNTSTAAITSSSASTEWITGNLLSYTVPSTPQNDFSMNFTFNTDKVSGTTITDSSANYSATLVGGGATIATTSPSPAPGTGYLSILNTYSPSPVTTNHVALPPITPPTGGMTLSFWLNPRENRASYIIQIGNGQFNNNIIFYLGNNNMFGLVIKGSSQGPYVAMSSTDNIDVTNGTWKHVVWTLDPSNEYKFYLNGSLTNTLTGTAYHYPNNVTTTQNYIGKSSYAVPYYNGDFDDFRIYNRVLSENDAKAIFMAGAKSKFSDETTGATWIPIPGTVVDTSETSYTVKSNEIALAPGTNSTYAVWTAPKPTNIRIDVSFADYHTRSAGVGFQMFKINSDNTFGSVIFPRTVTGNVLTNANSSNYLSVPSRSLSVSTGDKIYYRIDANGNTNAVSSVLATNIYSYSGKWS